MFISPTFLYSSSTVIFFTILSNSFHVILSKNTSLKIQQRSTIPDVNFHEFSVWFKNETTLTVLWEPPLQTNTLTEYRVSISPPDAEKSIHVINTTGQPVYVNFMKLVPGRAYTISEERINKISPIVSSVVYRTIPSTPSDINIDIQLITSHTFKIIWMPPDGHTEFDKYNLDVTTKFPLPVTRLITKTFKKTKTDYEVNQYVLPGHSYTVYLRTISGTISSKPISVNVTLKPLPVQNVTITESLKIVWSVDSVSQQDTFAIKYSNEKSSDSRDVEINDGKKEFNPGKLLPGRKYIFQIQAISNGMESEARSVSHITQPLAPIIEAVLTADDGIDISWKPDINYGQEQFQVVFHRNDSVGEPSLVLTNRTRVFLTHLYPGALYSVRVISVSKYAHQSKSQEVYQVVMPLPPDKVTAHLVNKNTLSVKWDAPVHSSISGFCLRFRTQDSQNWNKVSYGTELNSEQLINMLSGERYKIQVSSISYSVESRPVELQWITPPDPVGHVVTLLSSSVITLKFPPPQGRVDSYNVLWRANGTDSIGKQFPNTNNWERFVLLPIENLIPGIRYVFSITSVSYNIESRVTIVFARTWPVISSEIHVENNIGSPTSLVIHYSPPHMLSFDSFRFDVPELNSSTIKSVNDSNTSVRFDSVVPGKLYDIFIWTISDKVSSAPIQLQHRAQPEPISEVKTIGITESSVTITWNITFQGIFSGFEIRYLDIVLETSYFLINITELNPYQNYTFNISTLAGSSFSLLTRSTPVSVSIQTLESLPGKIRGFHPVDVYAHNITFVWSLPSGDQHGVITQFKLFSLLKETNEWFTRDIAPDENQATFTSLKPGRQYLFKIQAYTKVGFGPESVWEQQMPPLSPPRPGDEIFPTVLLQTTSTIQIRFRKNFFSDEHGVVVYYTIIVSEDLDDNSVIQRMPGWRDVQSLHPWPPYQVLEPYQFFTNTSVIDFTIGEETCVDTARYCNGPLKMGTTYKIKVRAFTRADLFTDTVYSHPVSTEDQFRVLYALGFVVVSIFLLGLSIIFRRNIRVKKAGVFSLQNYSHPIPIAELRTMLIDPDCLSKEFEELKLVGRSQTTLTAELPCNRPKNRFSNILPYDSSRYKLQSVDDEDGSDYVNANYIAGHQSPRQFIATQGPLASTRDDFWRMCWESKAPAIVMLTQCVEKGREKCHRYWPTGERALRCGGIDVHLLQVCHYLSWTVSHLRLCKGEEAMTIYHFHFTSWPDSGIPHSSQALVRFVLGFRARISPEQNPVIVHCSAGVGRTGTFIAVDTLAQRLFNLKVARSIDILETIYQLRKQRMYMVQTVEQYLYIYDCVKLLLQDDFSHLPESEVHRNEAFELDEGVDDL